MTKTGRLLLVVGIGVAVLAVVLAFRNCEKIRDAAFRAVGKVLTSPSADADRREKYGKVTVEHWSQFNGNMACGRTYEWGRIVTSSGHVLVEYADRVNVSPDRRWMLVSPKAQPAPSYRPLPLLLIDLQAGTIVGEPADVASDLADVKWSSAGDRVLLRREGGNRDGKLFLLRYGPRGISKATMLVNDNQVTIRDYSWSPEGAQAAMILWRFSPETRWTAVLRQVATGDVPGLLQERVVRTNEMGPTELRIEWKNGRAVAREQK